MPEFTLRLRRYDPESGEPAYWDEHKVDLEAHRSVLEGILQAKGRFDGSIGIRCSCRAAICGSCGVRINGEPGLACHTHLDAAAKASPDGTITVEPMGNMPVIKDLIVDMDAVHWKKIHSVTPWLINKEPVPEREYLVPRESMVDVTQSMACIQCGACVSDCLAMEVDPEFTGPAALAKAYRFVGDPRDDAHEERLRYLAEDPDGMYTCTHCFKCVDACPKGVNPMGQIMRLRRIAGSDHEIEDRNNGFRHEHAFVKNIRRNGLLHEADLLPDSYGGKFHPRAVPELIASLPVALKGLMRGKMTPAKALLHPHKASKELRAHFDRIEGQEERYELNLYVTGYDEDEAAPSAESAPVAESTTAGEAPPSAGSETTSEPAPGAEHAMTSAPGPEPSGDAPSPPATPEPGAHPSTEPSVTTPPSDAVRAEDEDVEAGSGDDGDASDGGSLIA